MGAIMTLSDSAARDGGEQTTRHQTAGPGALNAAAREGFEHGFLSVPFEVQLLECETNAIAPYLREYLPMDGLILEAGSDSGRWVEWLHREGQRNIHRNAMIAQRQASYRAVVLDALDALALDIVSPCTARNSLTRPQGRVDWLQLKVGSSTWSP